MKKLSIVSAVILSGTLALGSGIASAATTTTKHQSSDPVTGIVEGTGAFLYGLGDATFGALGRAVNGTERVTEGVVGGTSTATKGMVRGTSTATKGMVHGTSRATSGVVHGTTHATRGAVRGTSTATQGIVRGSGVVVTDVGRATEDVVTGRW